MPAGDGRTRSCVLGAQRWLAGATLTEAMVVVAIAAVLVTQGIPSLVDFVHDARRDLLVQETLGAFSFARSEAIKRGQRVTLCPSVDGANCRGNAVWEDGWIVFADDAQVGVVDPGEPVLRRYPGLATGNTLRGGSGRPRISFQGTGFSDGSNDTLRLCDGRGAGWSRSLVLNRQGRLRTEKTSASCP